MGYTQFSVDKLSALIEEYNVKNVLDLGAQNMYNQPSAPYARKWYWEQGINYQAIDITGENGAMPIDLSKPVYDIKPVWDMVVDAGTSEHVEGIYNCWKTKFQFLKIGGVMYNENPKTGNWPGHGQHYYTEEFYLQLHQVAGIELLELDEHPAMNNTTDGWNVYCSFVKTSDKFPTLAQFKKLDLRKV